MDHEAIVPVVRPAAQELYFADAPLRTSDDFGKWSDVRKFLTLIGYGQVLNFATRLRPHGGTGMFKGIQTIARIKPASCKNGMIFVNAGSDPDYDDAITLDALAAGDFDHSKLSFAVLSKLDFSRIAPCDIELTTVTPIGIGASVGSSAAILVSILRAFLGSGYPAEEIAKLALDAEFRIAGRNTGNQDHIASAWGSHCYPSACQSIVVNNLFDFSVRSLNVRHRIRDVFRYTLAIHLGSHDSSDIHWQLMEELSTDDELAKQKLLAMRQVVNVAEEAIIEDDDRKFRQACDLLLDAQRNLSPMLINQQAEDLICIASQTPGVGGAIEFDGACIPGAGGLGGTVILHLRDEVAIRNFVQKIKDYDSFDGCRIYKVRLADEPVYDYRED